MLGGGPVWTAIRSPFEKLISGSVVPSKSTPLQRCMVKDVDMLVIVIKEAPGV